MQKKYRLGFISQSHNPNEMRSPIWYRHLSIYPPSHPLIDKYIFEKDFGYHSFGRSADDSIKQLGYEVLSRWELLSSCDIVISLKPHDEWKYMQPNSQLVGWFNHLDVPPSNVSHVGCHDLENISIVEDGRRQKILYKNAYVAGLCSVGQTLDHLSEVDPRSPAIAQTKLAVVLGYGNLGKGAASELLRRGVENVVVFTQRRPVDVSDKLDSVVYRQMECGADNIIYEVDETGQKQPLIDSILGQADIIVNAKTLSKYQTRWTFIPKDKFWRLKQNMAFIDPVHRKNHGADFVEVTSFKEPLKRIEKSSHSIWFNGCNSMPNYDVKYASRIISESLLKHLNSIIEAVVEPTTLTVRPGASH